MAAYPQSTAYTRTFFVFLSSDHVTTATGKTVVMTISKAGGAFATASGVVSEISGGAYKIVLTTSDTNTLGDLAFLGTASSSDNVMFVDQVIDAAKGLGAPTNLDATISSRVPTATLPANFAALAISATGYVTVGGYASAQDPATYILVTPANKLTTSATGYVTVTSNLDKTGYALTQAFPSNFSALAITATGYVTVGTNLDKTGYALTQTFPTNFSVLAISATGFVTVGGYATTMSPAEQILVTPANKLTTSATGYVTVTSNLDKTGYALTQAFPSNFSALAITATGYVTVGTNLDKTGYTAAITAGSITAASFSASAIDDTIMSTSARLAIADALLDRTNAIETGITPRGALRIIGSAVGGTLSGASTTNVLINAMSASGTNRINAVTTTEGNRTTVTLNTA